MLKTRNFGRKSLNEIKEVLEGMGLEFGMEISEFGFPVRDAAGAEAEDEDAVQEEE